MKSPYVRGYEVQTISTTSLDVDNTRTTEKKENSSIPFTLGRQLELDNIHGSTPVGFSTFYSKTIFRENCLWRCCFWSRNWIC